MFPSHSRPLRAGLAVAAVAGLALLCVGHTISAQEAARPPDTAGVAAEGSRASDPLDEVREIRRRANREAVASQKRIDEISDETDKLFARYTAAVSQLEATRSYNRRMADLVADQEEELAQLGEELASVQAVGRSVTPLMLDMIDALDAFVRLDVPFLPEERAERIAELRETMARSDVSNAEKFRLIMDAYRTENEYGRTIEAYRGAIPRDGGEIVVDFLRFGRIALVYQTLDGSEVGAWNPRTRSWEELDASFRPGIRRGIRIARKQEPPDLVFLPILEENGTRTADAGGEG